MIQQLNQSLKQRVPYYTEALDLSVKTYKNPKQTASFVINELTTQINRTKQNVQSAKQQIQTEIMNIVENISNEVLLRAQNMLLLEKEKPSKQEKKQIRKRFNKIINKVLKDYFVYYMEQAKKYNMVLIKRGKQFYYANIFPLYITLKATLLVSKEILLEMLENRIDEMKMTYSVSKDTVTMLIGGKFEEDKIIEKISTGMENFKQMTVKVVKKGLQIKVDKESLYQNYQVFSSKLLEIIRQMREKGTQRIVSARQRSVELYQNVINRIREKQITLRMDYKQLKDQKSESSR